MRIKLLREWMGRPEGTIMPMVDGQAYAMIDRGQAEEFTGPLPVPKPPKEPEKPKPRKPRKPRGRRQTGRSNKQVQSPDNQK